MAAGVPVVGDAVVGDAVVGDAVVGDAVVGALTSMNANAPKYTNDPVHFAVPGALFAKVGTVPGTLRFCPPKHPRNPMRQSLFR